MKKINRVMGRGELKIGLLLIVIFQIFILINFTTATSYQISETNENNTPLSINNPFPENVLIKKSLVFLVSLLTIKQIGSVSASGEACCPLTNGGAICQNVLWNYEDCSENLFPTSCELTSDCKQGCCVDEIEGLCTTNSPMQTCTSEGGIWNPDASCNNIDECEGGCCILGGNSDWVTERRCQLLSAQQGFRGVNFTQHVSQVQCLRMRDEQRTGACVLSGNMCRFGTEADCVEMEGRFEEGKLCSNPDLNTTCLKQASVGCVEGKNEIYWLDSCGNPENIYSSDKDASWNNGNVLTKGESCSPNSNNINSATCGNCNYLQGSKCSESSGKKVQDGNFICADVNCVDKNGVQRKNGESWCVYDGTVLGSLGEGKDIWGTDIVGSRHWRKICVDGEIKNEPCADFRQQVCGKIEIANQPINESDVLQTSESIGCVANRWRECVAVTREIYSEDNSGGSPFSNWDAQKSAEFKKKCEDIGQCIYYEMKLSKTPTIPICMPMFPGGLDFYKDAGNETSNAESVCEIVTSIPYIGTCTKITLSGTGCSGCVSGCDCGTEKWLEEANSIANAFGDCGAYVNIAGDVSGDGYESGQELSSSYLNSLKKFYTNVTEGDVTINYNDIDANATGLGNLGKIITKGQKYGAIFGLGGVYGFISENEEWLLLYVPFYIFWKVIDFLGKLAGLWGSCKIKRTDYHYTALPYQAPTENQKCGECGKDADKPCTEYRCKSLGAACELTNINEENPTCFESNPNDFEPPAISLNGVKEISLAENKTKDYTMETTNQGIHVIASDEECVPEFTPIVFDFEASEYSQCKLDYEHTNAFDEMAEYLGGRNLFLINHTTLFYAPSIGSLSVYDISGDAKEKFGNLSMYVRCQDTHGNIRNDEFVVNFCLRSGPDFTPAIIVATNPANNGFTPYNSSEVFAKFFLSEPANCKWSRNSNLSYLEMENQMDCSHDLLNSNGLGWECNTTLPNVKIGMNSFYILCKDQPWLDDSNTSRNINAQVFNYTLTGTSTPLKIDSVTPSGVVYSGTEPISVTLVAKTSGGAENGKAICRYNFTDRGWEDLFYETSSTEHKQTFSSLTEGDYTIKVSCTDAGENYDEQTISLSAEVDSSPPSVVRAYRDGANLILNTNENAECAYNNNRCDYIFENGTSITSVGFSKSHSTGWNSVATYYIKCRDIFGNAPSGCTIIVKPSLLS